MAKRTTPTRTLTVKIPDLNDYRKWKTLAAKHCREAWDTAHPKRKKGRPSNEDTVFGACRELLANDSVVYSQNNLMEQLQVHEETKHLSRDTIQKHVKAFIETHPSGMWPPHKRKMNPTRARQVDKRLASFLKVNRDIYLPWLLKTFQEMKTGGNEMSVNEFCELEEQGAIIPPEKLQKQMRATIRQLLKTSP